MPFKKADMNAENSKLMGLLSTSEEARKAHKIFDDEYNLRLNIAKARKAKGLTQNQIKTHCGLTQQAISRIETGSVDDRSPTLRTVIRYLDAIGCELAVKPKSANHVKHKVAAVRRSLIKQ